MALATSVALFDSVSNAVVLTASLVAFVTPGLVLARYVFQGPLRWLPGAALGYWHSSLLASVLHWSGAAKPWLVIALPVFLGVALHFALGSLGRARARRSEGDEASVADYRALGALWLLVTVMAAIPFLNVAEMVADGRAYRAYFSADLMTHLSVIAELQKEAFPLRNPFYTGESLGYYWLFFSFPAAVGAWTSNQAVSLSLSLGSGLLFSGLLYRVGRVLGLMPGRALLMTLVAVFAASYDGLIALGRTLSGAESFTDVNVDAISRWVFELTSLDGLHRSVLYTPQHLFSYSLLLVLVPIVFRRRTHLAPSVRNLVAGSILGGMAGCSIVTAMLCGPWTVLVLFLRRASLPTFLRDASTISAFALSHLAWYYELGFFSDAGAALTVRLPRALEAPALIVIDAGALVFCALLAFRQRRHHGEKPETGNGETFFVRELSSLAVMSFVAVLFLDLRGYEGVWIAWRAGSVFLVSVALLGIPFYSSFRKLHALLVLPALLTLALDLWNARDIHNRRLSPGGFPWTTVVPADEWEALRFLREHTPQSALVQWDVRAREPGEWALIPAIAERRMAVGFPIFLLDLPKYRARERRRVRPIFNYGDASRSHELAVGLGIDYLVVGEAELQVRGERVRALFENERLFRTVFEAGDVAVLQVVSS
jgi:hypothetical protein